MAVVGLFSVPLYTKKCSCKGICGAVNACLCSQKCGMITNCHQTTRCISELEVHQNAFAAGAVSWTPLEELTLC